MAKPETRRPEGPLHFRIRFRGTLNASWFATMQGVTLSSIRTSDVTESTIAGAVPDEAALIGIVNMLYDLGCGLISVESLDKDAVPGASDASDAFGSAGPPDARSE